MSFQDQALVVELRITRWSANARDWSATVQIAAQYENDPAYARLNKTLLSKQALAPIRRLDTDIRSYLYDCTVPWGDHGQRLLPSSHFIEFQGKMLAFQNKREEIIRDFLSSYDTERERARGRLGKLFKEHEYPDRATLRTKYAFSWSYFPVPTVSDFRLKIADEHMEAIKTQTTELMREREAEVMRHVWDRVFEVVSHLAERLRNPDAIFRDSAVGNVARLVSLLPELNMTGDPELAERTKEIAEKLLKHDPELLRHAPMVRKIVADDAQNIADKVEAYLGTPSKADEPDVKDAS